MPITRVLLKENENLVLIFPKDISKQMVFELYFFRVMRRAPLVYAYDKLPELAPGAILDFNYLGKDGFGVGDDILSIWEQRPFRIYHFGIGVTPGDIRVYKASPSGTPQTGMAMRLPTKVGDSFDFFDASLSPYDEPTVASETYLYYKMSLDLGFANVSPIMPKKPRLKLVGASYDVVPIVDPAFIDKIMAGIKPARFATVGGLQMFTYAVPDDWKLLAKTYSRAEIAATIGKMIKGGE
ncbi:MAG: hypothetical protein QXT26_02705 [Thermoproteota archaeon]